MEAEGLSGGTSSSMDGSITSSPNEARSERVEELKQVVRCTKLELESCRAAAKAQAELHRVKVEQLEELLRAARRERDEAMHRLMELQSNLVNCSSSISSCSFPANTSFIADSPLDNSFSEYQSEDWFSFPAFDAAAGSDDQHLLTPNGQQESLAMSSFEADFDIATPRFEEVSPPAPLPFFDSCLQNGSALASILTPLGDRNKSNSGSAIVSEDCKRAADAEMKMMLKNLPERGKLLQAVMQAGPLLHTLLLAGPLPQWHHPPPGLDTFQLGFPSVSPGSFASSSLGNDATAQARSSKRQLSLSHKNIALDSQVC